MQTLQQPIRQSVFERILLDMQRDADTRHNWLLTSNASRLADEMRAETEVGRG